MVVLDRPPRILFLYGSLRERSYSRLLAEEADRYSERKEKAIKQGRSIENCLPKEGRSS